ncbi:hypothetical protein WJX77_004068 [Trebouxia sp. C0004]
MSSLVYSGEGASQPLVDDFSLTREQKWQLLFDKNWGSLAPGTKTKWLVYLRNWKKWTDDHVEQPEGQAGWSLCGCHGQLWPDGRVPLR